MTTRFWNCLIKTNHECTPEPDWEIPPTWMDIKDAKGNVDCQLPVGGKCKHTPDTCDRVITPEQIIERTRFFHSSGIHKNTKVKEEAKKEEVKQKAKKKKEEATNQLGLF